MTAFFDWLAAEFSNPLTATAQIIGFIPLALSFFTFLSNKRAKIIFIKIGQIGESVQKKNPKWLNNIHLYNILILHLQKL